MNWTTENVISLATSWSVTKVPHRYISQ